MEGVTVIDYLREVKRTLFQKGPKSPIDNVEVFKKAMSLLSAYEVKCVLCRMLAAEIITVQTHNVYTIMYIPCSSVSLQVRTDCVTCWLP